MTGRLTQKLLAVLTIGLACGVATSGLRGQENLGNAPQPLPTETGTVQYGEAMASAADYGCRPWEYGNPDLFYNFYVPNDCGGVPAAMYLAPRPVPPLVGHTYNTYQPLMPHEMLYPHQRTYRQWYDHGRGFTRTKVSWYCNPVVATLKTAQQTLRIPR
jgi:hypothetical protein